MLKNTIKGIWNIVLLTSTVFVVFLIAFFPPEWHRRLYSLGFTLVFFSSAFSLEAHRKFNIYFAVAVTVLDLVSTQFNLTILRVISDFSTIGFFLYMVTRFIMQISKSKYVDVKVIAESITGYLLFGMAFGILIAVTQRFDPASISFPSSEVMLNPELSHFSEYIYYSLVTLSTLGYGDVLPNAPYTKSLMTFITVSGQFYMAVVVALLIGKFASGNPDTKK